MRLLSVLLASSIGTAIAAEPPKRSVAYFYGPVKYLAPDGDAPFGENKSLIKRTVDPQAGRIEEIMVRTPRGGNKALELTTTLVRVGKKPVFQFVDSAKMYSGTVKFEGPEWAWTSWTYQLHSADGDKVTGTGTISATGMQVDQNFADDYGRPRNIIREDLKSITEAEYKQLHVQILGR